MSGSASSPEVGGFGERRVTISFGGSVAIPASHFFSDPDKHKEATATECAAEARRYIEEHGMRGFGGFIDSWDLDDCIEVWVDAEQVAGP